MRRRTGQKYEAVKPRGESVGADDDGPVLCEGGKVVAAGGGVGVSTTEGDGDGAGVGVWAGGEEVVAGAVGEVLTRGGVGCLV